MSWVIARKEVRDAARSHSLWAIALLSTLVVCGAVALPSIAFENGVSASVALAFLPTPIGIVVAITAMTAGYRSIAGERESGRLKVLLGLPHRRRDVIVGKLAGRSIVIVGALAIAFLAAALVLATVYGSVPGNELGRLFVLTLLYAGAFTGFAVGISAVAASRARAMAIVVGTFILVEFAWDWLPRGVYYVLHRELPRGSVPAWFVTLERLNPVTAYRVATRAFLDAGNRAITLSAEGAAGSEAPTGQLAERVAGEAPAYLSPEFAPLVFVLWFAIPPAIGAFRFRAADL